MTSVDYFKKSESEIYSYAFISQLIMFYALSAELFLYTIIAICISEFSLIITEHTVASIINYLTLLQQLKEQDNVIR